MCFGFKRQSAQFKITVCLRLRETFSIAFKMNIELSESETKSIYINSPLGAYFHMIVVEMP